MIALRSFGELVMRHRGARICVMGGGPTLADDIERVGADVWISANQHGAKLRPVDYVVAMDNIHTMEKVPMEGIIRAHTGAPIIGPWHWCDYGITNYPLAPQLIFTGVIAHWLAYMLGGHPVILAGYGCTGTAKKAYGQHQQIAPYVRGCETRIVSGPLLDLWPEYDPDERMPPYRAPTDLEVEEEHGVKVKVLKAVEIRGREFPIGTVLRAPRAEVWRQLKHRSLEELPA